MKVLALIFSSLNLVLIVGLGYVFYQQDQQIQENIIADQALKKEIEGLYQQLRVQRERIDQLLETSLPRAETISYREKTFDTYTIDLSLQELSIFLDDASGSKYRSLTQLKNTIEKENRWLVFATNAGMYTPQNTPVGLYVENGVQLYPLDVKEGQGNFYMKPNGVFTLTSKGAAIVESSQFSKLKDSIMLATQSGPLLVQRDSIHPMFNEGSPNLNIRSGVGILSPDKVVFAISNTPTNFYDFALLFKEYLGCKDALYLDGAISKMYLPALNRFELGGDFGPILGIVQEYPLE